MSLASPNVRVVEDRGTGLDIRYLMRAVPRDAGEIDALKRQVLGEDLFRKALISADQRATIVAADFFDGPTSEEITAGLAGLADRYTTPDVRVYFTGGPVLLDMFNRYLFHVWRRFLVAFAVIAAVLYLSFGTLQGMLIPLLSGGLSTFWALGIMGWLGIPLDMWNNMTPILVMAVTAGHSTQLLKRYYEELATTSNNRLAVEESVVKIAPVMLMGGLTAALGFASLAVFNVPSLRTFGVFTALGILCGTAVELTFVPALRSLVRPRGARTSLLDRAFARLMSALGRLLYRGVQTPFLAPFAVVAVIAVVGAGFLRADYTFTAYLPHGTRGERDFLAAQRLFPGTLPLVIVAEGTDQIAPDPKLVALVSGLQRELEHQPDVVYTMSYVDVLRQAARAMGAVQDGGDLPPQRDFLYQLLFLSYTPQYGRFLSRDFKTAAVWVFLRETETERIEEVLRTAQAYVDAHDSPTRGNGARIEVAGGVAATRVALTQEITHGKLLNILIVLGVIGVVASTIFRSVFGGLLVVFPLAFTVLVDLGALGILRIPLDPITASVTAMAVGIGADYAIYIIYRLREELDRGDDLRAAVDRAMVGAGRGIFSVALGIAAGYVTLTLASFRAFTMIGLLVSMTMIFSSVTSLTLLPLAVLRFRPRFVFRRAPEALATALEPVT